MLDYVCVLGGDLNLNDGVTYFLQEGFDPGPVNVEISEIVPWGNGRVPPVLAKYRFLKTAVTIPLTIRDLGTPEDLQEAVEAVRDKALVAGSITLGMPGAAPRVYTIQPSPLVSPLPTNDPVWWAGDDPPYDLPLWTFQIIRHAIPDGQLLPGLVS